MNFISVFSLFLMFTPSQYYHVPINTVSFTTHISEISVNQEFAVQSDILDDVEDNNTIPKEILKVTATAYSSTPDQTDSTPFIMASGKRVYDGAVAANFLPFGSTVRFPDAFGDKVFIVEDRMNRRFPDRVDIWMSTRKKALIFGIQDVRMEILVYAK